MDFQFTSEQGDIRAAAREFAEKEFPEIEKEIIARNILKKQF